MFSFLRRLFGSSKTATPAAASSTARASRPSQAIPAGGVSGPPAAAPPTQPDAAALQAELRKNFAAALHQLDDELIDEHRRSKDTVLLMRSLHDDPVTGIRQLPAAAQRALSLLHGEAPTTVLVELLQQDPAMTQALLHQVNSVYYNPTGARVVSLADAIKRMGRAGVQGVVFEHALAGMVSRPGGDLDTMAQQTWDHMVRTAPLARRLGPAFGAAPEECFLIGLMHDVGKLVIFDRITELRGTQRRALEIDRQIVSRALRLLHEPLGGLVVQQWGLDGGVARAVASHHREPVPAERDALCEVVFVAERVDLAQRAKQTPDLNALWTAGRLSGDRAAAEAAIVPIEE